MFGALVAAVFVASTATSKAQGRGHDHDRTSVIVVGGGFYSPYYYDPFFFADPWYGGYQYPIRPYGYGYRLAEPEASVRLEVKPKEAEVFVDGYYAGVVDDFDGTWQSLKLDSGGHNIEIRKPGLETLRFDVHVQPERSITFRGDMKAVP